MKYIRTFVYLPMIQVYYDCCFPDSAAQILNLDLDRRSKWAKDWLVSCNPEKKLNPYFLHVNE